MCALSRLRRSLEVHREIAFARWIMDRTIDLEDISPRYTCRPHSVSVLLLSRACRAGHFVLVPLSSLQGEGKGVVYACIVKTIATTGDTINRKGQLNDKCNSNTGIDSDHNKPSVFFCRVISCRQEEAAAHGRLVAGGNHRSVQSQHRHHLHILPERLPHLGSGKVSNINVATSAFCASFFCNGMTGLDLLWVRDVLSEASTWPCFGPHNSLSGSLQPPD